MGNRSFQSAPGGATNAHAGELSARESWQQLHANEQAVLLDVRTQAEWQFVGKPDLSSMPNRLVCLSWRYYPGMEVNHHFIAQCQEQCAAESDTMLLFLCRSGARSREAAITMAQAGFRSCYNIHDGFEGICDASGHRGTCSGWKAAQLPWRQD